MAGTVVGAAKSSPTARNASTGDATKLGWVQEKWLNQGLAASTARWNLIAQQTLMAQFRQRITRGNVARMGFWSDGWDGYPAARARLLQRLARTRNPLVIGGDIHSFWATQLKTDFNQPRSRTVASEFVCTSMTSRGIPGAIIRHATDDNPHVMLAEQRYRGYGLARLSAASCRVDLRALDSVATRSPSVRTLARFEVMPGRPGPIAVS